jgi:hypothetical protein
VTRAERERERETLAQPKKNLDYIVQYNPH